jgi:hypothetical protein
LANGVRGGGVGRPLEPNLARDRLFFAVPGENMANEEKPHDNSFVLCGLLELPPHGGGVGKVDFTPHFFGFGCRVCHRNRDHQGPELHFTSGHGLQGKSK